MVACTLRSQWLAYVVMNEITQVLNAIDSGDAQAAGQLLPLIYDELRKLAAQKLAQEQPGQTLQATALVHEAYLRLIGKEDENRWDSRGHFFAAAAEAMRRILVDAARRKRTMKRGGDRQMQHLDDIEAPNISEDLVALDDAMRMLADHDPLKAKLVDLRYFAGLTGDEAAKILGISPTTADRYWTYARAWLHARINGK
jgi:RNA polymerase sigma factor (TIGR02999 family)